MATKNHYTFGDSARAARRLGLLAQVYDAPSRELLERFRRPGLLQATDLGSGPGHTTRLVHEVLAPRRTLGIDSSPYHIAVARRASPASIQFIEHDLLTPDPRIPPAEVVFCRFLLTHVADPAAAIAGFWSLVKPGGALLIQETSALDTHDPILARYYELVGELQRHYGQRLYVGRDLEPLARGTPFAIESYEERRFARPAAVMAELHALNIATWKEDAFARDAFDPIELRELDAALLGIAGGARPAPEVSVGLGELVLRR